MTRANRQRGFSLIAAVFLVAVIGALALVMTSLTATQDRVSVYSVLTNQAYFAARSGLEYAADRALNGACGNESITLEQYTVDTQCIATVNIDEGTGTLYNVYNITVRAHRGSKSTATFVSRTVRAAVTDAV